MKRIILSLVLAVCGWACAGVYDDAIFWFRGGKATGPAGTGSLFDEMHADAPAHANHGAVFYGDPDCRSIEEEDVLMPCWRDIPIRTKVLRLRNTAKVEGTTTNLWQNWADVRFLRPQVSNEYTVVMRLRQDALATDGSTAWLTRFGYNGGSGGVLFGLRGADSTTNRCLLCCYQTKNASGGSAYAWGETTVRIPPTNEWFDVALVVSNNLLRVGVSRRTSFAGTNWNDDNKKVVEFKTISSNMYPTYTTGGVSLWKFFAENGDTARKEFSAGYKGTFCGSVQQIAIWNRALGDDDVREAWGGTGIDLWQVGLANGADNEFAAGAAPVAQTIDPYRPWHDVSPRLKAGATWTVPFTGLAQEAGMMQVLSFTSQADSPVATVRPAVNGTALAGRTVLPGRTQKWYVPGALLKSGDNTLTLTRTDAGAEDVVMDTMSLGGSWQIGVSTVDWGNLQSESRTDTVPTTLDIARRHWPQAANVASWTSNRTFKVWVPKETAERCPSMFTLVCNLFEAKAESDYTLGLKVNGVERDWTYTFGGKTITSNRIGKLTGRTKATTSFEPGDLQPGWNTFNLGAWRHNRSVSGGYYLFNSFRFELTGHPAYGTILLIR